MLSRVFRTHQRRATGSSSSGGSDSGSHGRGRLSTEEGDLLHLMLQKKALTRNETWAIQDLMRAEMERERKNFGHSLAAESQPPPTVPPKSGGWKVAATVVSPPLQRQSRPTPPPPPPPPPPFLSARSSPAVWRSSGTPSWSGSTDGNPSDTGNAVSSRGGGGPPVRSASGQTARLPLLLPPSPQYAAPAPSIFDTAPLTEERSRDVKPQENAPPKHQQMASSYTLWEGGAPPPLPPRSFHTSAPTSGGGGAHGAHSPPGQGRRRLPPHPPSPPSPSAAAGSPTSGAPSPAGQAPSLTGRAPVSARAGVAANASASAWPLFVVVAPFTAETEWQMTVSCGDTVSVRAQHANGWWEVDLVAAASRDAARDGGGATSPVNPGGVGGAVPGCCVQPLLAP